MCRTYRGPSSSMETFGRTRAAGHSYGEINLGADFAAEQLGPSRNGNAIFILTQISSEKNLVFPPYCNFNYSIKLGEGGGGG